LLNIDVAQTATFPAGDQALRDERQAKRRTRRKIDLIVGAGIAVAAPFALLMPGRWTLLALVFMVALFIGRRSIPRVLKFIAFAVIPYQLIWTTFIILRGFSDEAPWVDRIRLWPRHLEVTLFGGELPTSMLQRHFFDSRHLHLYDYFFTSLHLSFFFVPFLVAMPLCWVDPARGRRFLVALAVLLGSGLPFFYLLPANPPWMDPATGDPNPVAVERINAYVAADWGIEAFQPDGTLDSETNSLAVVPSMHMGVSFLLALSAPRKRRRWRQITATYAGLMAFSLVYLGEHQVIDEVAGIGLALMAWRIAPGIIAALSPRLLPVSTAVQSRFAGVVAEGRRAISVRRRADAQVQDGGAL
jgi:PAP2 superfamily